LLSCLTEERIRRYGQNLQGIFPWQSGSQNHVEDTGGQVRRIISDYKETQALYDRWLGLKVVEGKYDQKTGKSRTLLVGEARSTGISSDLREVLNPLLIAAFEQFGKNTSKAVPNNVSQMDPRFKELKGVQ
jgi:hypothetical protein